MQSAVRQPVAPPAAAQRSSSRRPPLHTGPRQKGGRRSCQPKDDQQVLPHETGTVEAAAAAEAAPVANPRPPSSSRKQRNTRKASSTSPRSSPPPVESRRGKHRSTALTCDAVMAANESAMAALRGGEVVKANQILTSTLNEVRRAMQRLQVRVESDSTRRQSSRAARASRSSETMASTSSTGQPGGEKDAWLLAYSVTLNNLGCQLRRANRAEEALEALHEASRVEADLFGRASCSTMLNLSAVLLGMGASVEALQIAKDCVVASREGDRVLFITALHNLAMALGQQSGERERQSALPIMLRALREAQEHLGEAHPTTLMLKERCGMTEPWIAVQVGDSPPQEAGKTAASVAESARYLRKPPTPPGAYRTSAAHHLPPLHMNTVPAMPTSELQAKAQSALQSIDFGTPFSPNELPTKPRPLAATWGPHTHVPPGGTPAGVDELPVAPLSAFLQHPQVVSRAGVSSGGSERASDVAAAVHHEARCSVDLAPGVSESADQLSVREAVLDSTPSLSSPSCPPLVDASAPCGARSTPGEPPTSNGAEGATGGDRGVATPAAPVGEEASPTSASGASDTVNALTSTIPRPEEVQSRPALLLHASTAHVVAVGATPQPSFMRFAAVQDADGVAPPVTALTFHDIHATLNREAVKGADASSAQQSLPLSSDRTSTKRSPRAGATPPPHLSSSVDTPLEATQKSLFRQTQPLRSSRGAVVDAQRAEEEAYRERREAEKAAAEREAKRQADLERIVNRTRSRAACTIQRAWASWWGEVGKPRQDLQRKRAAERERQLRERLIAASTAQGGASQRGANGAGGIRSKDGGVLAAPTVVVRCGRLWLAKTACLRYLALHGISAQGRREAEVCQHIVRVQAMWRGMQDRARYRELCKAHEMAKLRVAPNETEDYAATVLQHFFRTLLARRQRERLAARRYAAPVHRIEKWYAAVMASQRARGTDTQSATRRVGAAIRIQRTWRGYQARVQYYMARLQYRMNESRRKERANVLLVQRVSRGYLTRRELRGRVQGRRRHQQVVRQTTELMQEGKRDTGAEDGKDGTASRFPPLTIPRTAYEAECLERAPLIAAIRDQEREAYDVALFYAPRAADERAAWLEASELRPTQVAVQRAILNLRSEREVETFRRRRAATAIQRAFREWRSMRDNPKRDRALLEMSRARYQRQEHATLSQRKARAEERARVCAREGDCAASVREFRCIVSAEAADDAGCIVEGKAVGTGIGGASPPTLPVTARTKQERAMEEAAVRREEIRVTSTYPDDLRRLRQDPLALKAETQAAYEHPYYRTTYSPPPTE